MTSTLSNRKGFTLVETLVAVAILATAIIGPFVAIQSALNASYAARDQLVATMLAQEAIEYVRSIRDGNYLYNVQNPSSPRSWFYGLDGTGGSVNCVDLTPDDASVKRCTVDPTGNAPIALCGTGGLGTCDNLNFAPATSLYTQSTPSGYVESAFTRSLMMSEIGTNEMKITVTVTFSSGHRSYNVTLVERLSNWL